MKKILIPLILLFSLSVYAQQNEKTKIDSLKNEINSLSTIVKTNSVAIDSLNKALKNQTITFDIKDWDNKKKVFDKSTDWLAIVMQFLALLIPILIAVFAGRYALQQINKQGKWSLLQTKANNIAQARIKWINDLRDLLCSYIGEVAIVNYNLSIVIDENKKGNKEAARKKYDSIAEQIKMSRVYATKINLFLNTDHENTEHKHKDHNDLEKLTEEFMESALSFETVKDDINFNKISDDMIKAAKKILKETWEQAKNEGQAELAQYSK